MEKIYTKAIANEIISKGQPADGYADIFSYEPDSTEDLKKLGSLFVVGHVHHESDDMAYLVNLVAALAKREYFARPNLPPKEAFTSALVKINDVVEEFFRNKGLEMNIGIFAIAGDQAHIARIGKFKIFLARDGETKDVLNNVSLFTKEHVENREFSNVISGKIQPGDRILAFYPGQHISTRERFIKSYFLKLAESEFVDKINILKSKNEQFSCALLYITMQNVKETALAPRIEPQELAQAQLASAPAAVPSKLPTARLTSVEPVMETVHEHTEPIKSVPEVMPIPVVETQEVPKIIPSEFSLGRRDSTLTSLRRKFRLPKFRLTRTGQIALAGAGLVIVTAAGFAVKSIFFVSPEAKHAKVVLEQIQKSLADSKEAAVNDPTSARNMLLASLDTIRNELDSSGFKKEADEKTAEVMALLDTIDGAHDISPALFYQIPAELGGAKYISGFEGALFAYSLDSTSNIGYVTKISAEGSAQKFDAKDINPEYLYENTASPVLFSKSAGQIASLKDGAYAVYAINVPQDFVSGSMYQDNLYVLTRNDILKITDAAKGSQKSQSWLAKGSQVPGNGRQILVDGDLHILTSDGTIATYYKGAKRSEIRLPFTPDDSTVLLSSSEESAASFYVFRQDLKRIYAIDRKSGAINKTYKISSSQDVLAVALGTNDTVYFLTGDNKIWLVK